MKTHNKTAVEWFAQNILSYKSPTNLNGTDYILIPVNKVEYLEWKAKEKEKEQIKEAYTDGIKISNAYIDSSDYYDQNYKSETNE